MGKFYVVRPSDPEPDDEDEDPIPAPFWLVLVHSTGSEDLMMDGVEHVRVHYLTIEGRKKVTKKHPER